MLTTAMQTTAQAVQDRFDALFAAQRPGALTDAMAYATRGGKRLRAFLVTEGAALHGLQRAQSIDAACAIEAIHAYSLVHDDLPAMDDDDLRRGQPTVHKAWDDATAILAGDALQTLGFELVSSPEAHPDPSVRADLALSLARASGAQGMVLGQALDIAAESAGEPLSLDQITDLQAGKTGALIVWSAQAGARLAQADLAPLTAFATHLGLAFQIADDLLDIEGDAAAMGKAVGKDADRGKATFVSHLGVDGARAQAHALVSNACDALEPYAGRAERLRDVARFVVSRKT